MTRIKHIPIKQVSDIAYDKIKAYYASYQGKLGIELEPYIQVDRVLNMLMNQLGNKYAPLMEFELKALDKWYGPQGGHPTVQQAINGVDKYYDNHDKQVCKPAPDGINILITQIEQFMNRRKLRPYTDATAWERASKSTNSGATFFGKRNDPEIQMASEQLLTKTQSFQPLMVMTRYSKNSLRIIFNDDIINYIIEAKYVLPLYDFFKENVNGAMMLKGRYSFTRHLSYKQLINHNTIVLEGDADKMDTTVTLQSIQTYVEPILFFMFPESMHRSIRKFHIDLFNTDLIMPDLTMRQGEHSLFSGILPTNIYETIIMLVIHYDRLANSTYENGTSLIDEAELFAIGDDVLLLLNGKRAHSLSSKIRENPNYQWIHYNGSVYAGDVWQANLLRDSGLKANESKQRTAIGNAFFCKRWFSPLLPSYTNVYGAEIFHSSRSLIATTNSINNPEYGRQTGADELLRIFGILDDAFGHPRWQQYVDMVYSNIRKLYSGIEKEELTKALSRYGKSRDKVFDWILEGYNWTMDSSPAWHAWVNKPFDISKASQY